MTVRPDLTGVDDLGLLPGRGLVRRPVVRAVSALPVLGAHRPGPFRARFAA